MDLVPYLCQGLAAHQPGAQPAEFTLGGIGAPLEQLDRDDAVQQRIAEELEPLVVAGAGATMGECPLQQTAIAERIAQGGKESPFIIRAEAQGSTLRSKLATRSILKRNGTRSS